jgi:hypothetical protein
MKSIRKITALITLAMSVFASSGAEAASYKIETIVPGYTGYVVVRPELRYVLGGRVRWNSSIKAFETDRVARGERLRITVRPSTLGERCNNFAIAGVTSSNGFAAFNLVSLPKPASESRRTRLSTTSCSGPGPPRATTKPGCRSDAVETTDHPGIEPLMEHLRILPRQKPNTADS